MVKTRNPLPTHCELCDARLPVDDQARPRYRLVLVWSSRRTPLGLRACQACHDDWLHPSGRAETLGLPLFAGL